MDASQSFDPEGKELQYSWDLDWSTDSDKDGDLRNDIDAITPTVLLPTNNSGKKLAALQYLTAMAQLSTSRLKSVSPRTSEVSWRTEEITFGGMIILNRVRHGRNN